MRRLVLPALLVLALCPYFLDLSGSSIWDANEAFYVETPREMIEQGDYIHPSFNYEPRINKPVLSYWIVAGFYHLFGVSEGVQRIPIALGALVLVATAFLLARAAAPGAILRRSFDDAGWWAAIGLAVSPRLVMFGRRIFIDIYISMFMALTLLLFALAERVPARRRLFLVLMYVSVGLGVLTKGPIAALLPGLVFGVYLAAHRELRRVGEMMIPAGVVIVLAIVVPWYAAMYPRWGWDPVWSFVFGENLARYAEGVGVNVTRPFYYYLPVVVTDAFPWSILLGVAATAWFRERRIPAGDAGDDAPRRVRTLLWLWLAVIVGFFSLSSAKQDLYIFPIVPAVAALAGVAIARALGDRGAGPSSAAGAQVTAGALGALLAGVGVGVLFLARTAVAVQALDGTAAVGVIAVAGGLIAVVCAWRRELRASLLAAVVTLVVANLIFVTRILPSFEIYKPSPRFARFLAERAAPDDVIATFNVALPSLVYYLQRRTEIFYDVTPAARLLEENRVVFLMLHRHDYAELDAATAAPTCVLHTQPTFDVKLKNVLARAPLPEIVLVTNRCPAR